jgi:hypothetical protein
LFDLFARSLVNENRHAVAILDELVMNKVKRSIESLGGTIKREERVINELDHDSLYGLIEDSKRERVADEDV